MNRIDVRIPAAVLAATVTFGLLAGIKNLAAVTASGALPVVVLPEVVVTGSRSVLLADACSGARKDAWERSVAGTPRGAGFACTDDAATKAAMGRAGR
jgi:hypothetical protein